MNVLVVEPGYAPYEKKINGLEEMQATVGGTIRPIYPYEDRVALVCNEDGFLLNLEFNRVVPCEYGGIVGTFFICGLSQTDFCSLTPQQMEKYKKLYHHAEVLLGFINDRPFSLRVPPKDKAKMDSTPKKPKRSKKGRHAEWQTLNLLHLSKTLTAEPAIIYPART